MFKHRISCLLYGLALTATSIPVTAYSQVTVSGPNCVTAGTVYLYNISGQWQAGSTVQVCITGGILVDSGQACAGGSGILSFVRVAWDSGGITSGAVAVTTTQGNNTIAVTIAQALTPGQIDSAAVNQTLDSLTTPSTLTCSAPGGGGCSISYQYQWQQSFDNVIWRDMDSATSAQLSFSGPLSQTTYYRRIVTNVVSNAFGYSNVATINIPIAQ